MTGFRAIARIVLLAPLAAGCASIGGGPKTQDLGDGKHRIETPDLPDAPAETAAAAHAACPEGYTIVSKNKSAEALYGSMIVGADTATVWIIKCGAGK